jgi:hypothetical protein
VHQKRATLRGPSSRTVNFLVMESLVVMAMEYLVWEVNYLVKSGFERLKFMVKVERSLNSRCLMVTKDLMIM